MSCVWCVCVCGLWCPDMRGVIVGVQGDGGCRRSIPVIGGARCGVPEARRIGDGHDLLDGGIQYTGVGGDHVVLEVVMW